MDKNILTMKKQYIPPTLKVVSVKMERGFQTSYTFQCQQDNDLFLMHSNDGEFRTDHFNYDDWSSPSPSPNDGQYGYNDWGSM